MKSNPKIYVLAGANGIGKTTVHPFFVPEGITYINADDIARQLRERLGEVNVQELANAQALERMNAFIAKHSNFAIETNLADQDTWLFLKGLKGLGYTVHINFFGVTNVEICIHRVKNRVPQGGHFVHPDIVKMRYEAGLKLLKQHLSVPDLVSVQKNMASGQKK